MPTILLIDTTAELASPLRESLTRRGEKLLTAVDGIDAPALAVAECPELIVMGTTSAKGLAFCRWAKTDVRTRDIPIVVLSDSATAEEKLAGFAAGAADFITHPMPVEEMLARIDVHLATRRRLSCLEAMASERTLARVGNHAFPDDALFADAIAMLEQRLANPLGLVALAQELGCHERKLTEVFRRRLGVTVFDYFTELRLETARRLLDQSAMRVKAISLQVGYRNAGDFTRAFRRRYGMGPREFRRLGEGRKPASA